MFYWLLMNLAPPLLAIPIILGVLNALGLLKTWREGLYELLGDGQLCFYAIAVISASGYELFESNRSAKGIVVFHVLILIGCATFFVLAVTVDRMRKAGTPNKSSLSSGAQASGAGGSGQASFNAISLNLEVKSAAIITILLSLVSIIVASGTHLYLKI